MSATALMIKDTSLYPPSTSAPQVKLEEYTQLNLELTMLFMEAMEANRELSAKADGCIIVHEVEGYDDFNAHNLEIARERQRQEGKNVLRVVWTEQSPAVG